MYTDTVLFSDGTIMLVGDWTAWIISSLKTLNFATDKKHSKFSTVQVHTKLFLVQPVELSPMRWNDEARREREQHNAQMHLCLAVGTQLTPPASQLHTHSKPDRFFWTIRKPGPAWSHTKSQNKPNALSRCVFCSIYYFYSAQLIIKIHLL